VADPWTLAWLVAPVSQSTFLERYWDSHWWALSREDETYYSTLVTLRDLDEVLSTTGLRAPVVRLVRDGVDVPASRLATQSPIPTSPNLDALYDEFRLGATIGLNFLQERHDGLAALCRSISRSLSGSAQVNAYITPAGSRGLMPHYDDHDVFVLQIEGRKRWRIYRNDLIRPLRGQPFRPDPDRTYELDEEFELEPGDLLYLPRGTVHAAEGIDVVSGHLTVGVSTLSWADVLLQEVERIVLADPEFRASLPPGLAHQGVPDATRALKARVDRLVSLLDLEGAIRIATRQVTSVARDELKGQLVDLVRLPSLAPATRCTLREGCEIVANAIEVVVQRNGKVVHLPLFAVDALRYAERARTFVISDLPGLEDEESRMVLARRLIEEGIFKLESVGTTRPIPATTLV
jgi:hypothetical protein